MYEMSCYASSKDAEEGIIDGNRIKLPDLKLLVNKGKGYIRSNGSKGEVRIYKDMVLFCRISNNCEPVFFFSREEKEIILNGVERVGAKRTDSFDIIMGENKPYVLLEGKSIELSEEQLSNLWNVLEYVRKITRYEDIEKFSFRNTNSKFGNLTWTFSKKENGSIVVCYGVYK